MTERGARDDRPKTEENSWSSVRACEECENACESLLKPCADNRGELCCESLYGNYRREKINTYHLEMFKLKMLKFKCLPMRIYVHYL